MGDVEGGEEAPLLLDPSPPFGVALPDGDDDEDAACKFNDANSRNSLRSADMV